MITGSGPMPAASSVSRPGSGPVAAVPPKPAIDKQVLLNFLEEIGGDQEAFAEILQIYLEDAPRLLREMEQALAKDNSAGLFAASHTLKGTSASIGAMTLSQLCQELNLAARAGNAANQSELLARSLREFQRVRAALLPAAGSALDVGALLRQLS